MLRRPLLWLSRQPTIFKFLRGNRLARYFASRFVAGETIDTAVTAAVTLKGRGITASLDILGESVAEAAAAEAACGQYLACSIGWPWPGSRSTPRSS